MSSQIPVLFERKRFEMRGITYIVVGFSEKIPAAKFHAMAQLMREYGFRYIPETKAWTATLGQFMTFMHWLDTPEAREHYPMFFMSNDLADLIEATKAA